MFRTATIANHTSPWSTAVLNMTALAMNPTVGGIPNSDSSPITIMMAMKGDLRINPLSPDISGFVMRCITVVYARNTAKFVNAYPAK